MIEYTTEEIIKQFKEVHGDRYGYSKVKYINTDIPVTIICPIHGEFMQTPYNHKNAQNCPHCAGNQPFTTEKIIEQFKAVHGDRYDYSDVKYVNAHTKVKIKCKIHGVFEQSPHVHKNGGGCRRCTKNRKLGIVKVIKQFRAVHGYKYDYSQVDYRRNDKKVKIICPEHGMFEQTPGSHKSGVGCPRCAGNKKLTTEEVVAQFKKVHGDKYNYSQVHYKNDYTPVTIICSVHGKFTQIPSDHKQGKGCPDCGGTKLLTTQKVIEQFKAAHGDRYDYSRVQYVNNKVPVSIICSDHGVFEQLPSIHKKGADCPLCVGRYRPTTEEIIEQFIAVHGDRYDYSDVKYVNAHTKVKIKCKIHGVFEQSPEAHKNGAGCLRCAGQLLTTQDIIRQFKAIHGGKYDYSKVKYVDNATPVTIICPDHGEFTQSPNNHKSGKGCPSCMETGFDPSESAILYYLSVQNGRAYKIGITNRSVEKRFCLDDLKNIVVIKEWHYAIGRDAYIAEKYILKKFSDAKWTEDDLLKSGNSELFKYDILGLDENKMTGKR